METAVSLGTYVDLNPRSNIYQNNAIKKKDAMEDFFTENKSMWKNVQILGEVLDTWNDYATRIASLTAKSSCGGLDLVDRKILFLRKESFCSEVKAC